MDFFTFIVDKVDSLALILSIFAFFLTFWSVWLQREHNRLSLRPYPDIAVADYENRIAVTLQNKGLGPLIVEKVEVFNNGVLAADNLIDLMPKLSGNLVWSDFIKNIQGRVLGPDDEKILLELSGDNHKASYKKDRNLIRRSLKDLTIRIHYRGIYKDKFDFCERNLDWFGRNI